MPVFTHDGLDIAFIDEGEGEAILLIHGFASNIETNWRGTGWIELLVHAGWRVVALDNRGHGYSAKPYEARAYDTALMAGDAAALLDRLKIEKAVVMGYSMGARITATLALQRPDLVRALILGGLGIRLVDGAGLPTTIADAMEAASLDDVKDPMGRTFRVFADQTKADRRALAACIRGSRQTLSVAEVARITQPALIAIGTRDKIAGSASELAALMPDAQVLDIEGRDHNPAVGDKQFKKGALAFLETLD